MSESKIEEIKDYHDNGQLSAHYYIKDGKLHGEYREWCKNGHIWEHTFYLNGKGHGEYKWWYINGRMYEHAFYNNGKFHGEYKLWHDNGHIWEHTFYKDDNELDKYIWDCLIRVQRSYRVKYNLKKYFKSKAFVEWWYHPDMPGGKAAKKELESFVDSL